MYLPQANEIRMIFLLSALAKNLHIKYLGNTLTTKIKASSGILFMKSHNLMPLLPKA